MIPDQPCLLNAHIKLCTTHATPTTPPPTSRMYTTPHLYMYTTLPLPPPLECIPPVPLPPPLYVYHPSLPPTFNLWTIHTCIYLLSLHVIRCDKISLPCIYLYICIMKAIKFWQQSRPGNETNTEWE